MLVRNTLNLIVFLFCASFSFAQIEIPSPKKAGKTDDKVSVANQKEVKQFERYVRKWGQPQTLFLEKGVQAVPFFNQYFFLDELSQLVFKGDNNINKDLLCEITGLEHVIFHVNQFDSSIILAINSCSFIKEISFYFEKDVEVDERWFNLKHVETLNILGIFTRQQMEAMVPLIAKVDGLKTLRFSTDFTRDLPQNLDLIQSLEHIGMVDNLSLIQSQTFHDLAVENHYINYWDAKKKKNSIIKFDYFSDRVSLESYDFDYLSGLFGKGQVLPYYAYKPLESKNNKTARAKKSFGKSTYSYFDTVDRSSRPELVFYKNKFVSTLKNGAEDDYEHFEINPKQSHILQSKRGYKITIPANILLNKDNELCSKTVDVYFKLITKPMEFALMGIPSTYDSLNEYYRLANTTAILFYASCSNLPLKIKKGFAVDVEMPAVVGRKWQLSTYSPYWYPYDFLDYGPVSRFKIDAFNDTQSLQKLVDFTSLEARYFSPDYYYILDEEDQRVKVPKSLKPSYPLSKTKRIFYPYKKGMTLEKGSFYIKPGKALVGVRRVSFSDTARKRNTYFRVYNKKDNKLFPELKTFRKYVFKYTGSEARRTFTKNLLRGNKFHDVRIFYQAGSATGVVELKYADGYVQLPFSVVDKSSRKSAAKQKNRFLKLYLKYKKSLENRKLVHVNHLDNFNIQVNAERPDIGNPQILTIIEPGIYAIAKLDSQQAESNINLNVNDVAGLPIDVKQIVVIYKYPNSIEYFSSKSIRLNFDREFAIVVTDYKNNLYYITASSCLSLKSGEGSVKSINARLVKPELENAEVLYKNLGFKKRR